MNPDSEQFWGEIISYHKSPAPFSISEYALLFIYLKVFYTNIINLTVLRARFQVEGGGGDQHI